LTKIEGQKLPFFKMKIPVVKTQMGSNVAFKQQQVW